MMEWATSDMVLLAIAAIIVIFIFAKVAKAIFRVVGIAVVVIIVYILWTGNGLDAIAQPTLEAVFKRNNISELRENYCSESNNHKAVCQCIVQPVYGDLERRFRKKKLVELEADKERLSEEVLKSLHNKKEDIEECLKAHNSDKVKVLEGIKGFYERVKDSAKGLGNGDDEGESDDYR